MTRDVCTDQSSLAPHTNIGTDRNGTALYMRGGTDNDVPLIAQSLAIIDPWARLGIDAAQLAAVFDRAFKQGNGHIILRNNVIVAAFIVEPRWLFGPYLKSFAVLAPYHGYGIGRAALAWIVADASRSARNIWVCVSAFNAPAIALYKSAGFVEAAQLDGLVVDHEDELLLRLRCGTAA